MEKEDYLASSLERLDKALDTIWESDQWAAWLKVSGRFHKYSPTNSLLIMLQNPNATQVAGFNTWKSLGRTVMKGEKSIRIIAPNGARVVKDPDDEDKERRIQFFKAVPVFDVGQTEGKPLPTIDVPVLQGDEGGELFKRLEAAVNADGVSVHRDWSRFTHSETTMGFYLPGTKEIHVRPNSQLQETKTLAHEVAHHEGKHEGSSSETETIAESVALAVLARYGHDSSERSFPYVAVWAKEKNTLRAAMGEIQRLSSTIIQKVEGDSHATEQDK